MADIPTTGPEALLYALKNLDVERLEEESRNELRSGRVSKRSKAINILNAVEGLKKNELRPDELMIHSVPVIPAKFRPFTVAGGTFIPGQANELYKDLIELRDSNGEELDLFGRNTNVGSRLNVYDAVRAAFGYGDPVKPKTKQRGASGLLKQVTGTTPKMGFFQKKVLSKPQDSVGRSTITVDPELKLNEIGLPDEMVWTMYAPYIQRALVMKGFSKLDALRALKGRTKDADMALNEVLEGTPSQPARLAISSRSPAWHKFNVLAFKVKRRDGENIAINPLVTTGYNADFDGDTMNIHVPSSDKAVQEAHEKLLPSKMLFSIKNPDKVVPEPKQEQILGLYTATKRPATQTRYFETEKEALDAIERRELNLYDDVVVGEHYGMPKNPTEEQKAACIKLAMDQSKEWEKTAAEMEIENALSPDLVDEDDYQSTDIEGDDASDGTLSDFSNDLLHATGDHPDGSAPQNLSTDELENLVGRWSELPPRERQRAEQEAVETTGRSVMELLGDVLAFKEAALRAASSTVEDILNL